MRFVFLGLSITSSWGNGHATTYRGLVRELTRLGHEVLFLERDAPWYADNRDLPAPPWGTTRLYADLAALRDGWRDAVRGADVVIVGSYVPEGAEALRWVLEEARGLVAFYDIDTPVTLARLARGDLDYLAADLIPGLDLYLSFTGGPVLRRIEQELGAPCARALYCSADPDVYHPRPGAPTWDLGYLGTYSPDRQPKVEALLCAPARALAGRRFVVAGPQYPADVRWPANVERLEHLPPPEHRAFYNAQRFTLNVTREDMARAGWSPSVRLFEAAACGTAIISDRWDGLDELFLPGEEVLLADGPDDVERALRDLPEVGRRRLGARARERVLAAHTAAHRALELEGHVREVQAWS
ncbi:MAG: glycosyltransferase [Planctomycetes bacterium]|nr:glycosyltransferase [Planctomycetota bacterium]